MAENNKDPKLKTEGSALKPKSRSGTKIGKNNPLPGNQVRTKPEYIIFIQWFALPKPLRKPATQAEFAENFKLSEQTLSNWKQMPEFKIDIIAQVLQNAGEHFPDIMWAWQQRMKSESAAADIKLYLEWYSDWKESLRLEGGSSDEVKEILLKIYQDGKAGKTSEGPRVVPDKYKK